MYKILIVEDDPVIRDVLERQLGKWGYQADAVTDFDTVMSTFGEVQPHLVLLDITLPAYSGYHWCSEIRKVSRVPIIFISSACDDMNLVMAMNMGGDDFIAKPFSLEVVTAKLQALLRRTYSFGGEPATVSYGDVVLGLGDARLRCGSAVVELTRNELRILEMLMEARGEVVSREQLMQRLWQDESFVDENTLTVNVARLRRKLEETGLDGFIQTVKGLGYTVTRG